MRSLILTFLLLISSVWLFADAGFIRNNVLSNMPEFGPHRTPSETHGNLYGKEDTAFIAARYGLPTFGFSLAPEKVQVTYFTKVTLVFSDYPVGNKIVVNWGDSSGSSSTVYAPTTNVVHQYSSQVQSYNVTIKTYRFSGTTYIEEPEHEISYEVGIFPYNETEEVATVDGGAVGNLTHYQGSVSGNIKKPILIVEGFNLHNTNTVSSIIGLNPSFYKNLLTDGYDLYILTFADCQNSLYLNAGLVLSALNSIKANHADGGVYAGVGCQPIRVLGYSMGGVLARIALASAEDQNDFAHGCNLLLTVDSPHRGFVINSNLQNRIDDIEDLLPEDSDLASELMELVGSPIARQFMRNNINANTLPYDFIDGSDEYRSVFDFLNPCDAYNVTHINQDFDYYYSGNYNPQLDFKSGFPWKQNNIKKYAVAFGPHEPIGNTGSYHNFASIQIKWKIFGFPGSWNLTSIPNAWYDKCPASYFPTEFHFQQKIIPDSFGNSTLEQFIGWIIGADDLKFKFNVNYDLPVVPVISSLCITDREFAEPSQSQYIPYTSAISQEVQTPFDDYYIPYDASPHQVLSHNCAGWIRTKLRDIAIDGSIGQIDGKLRHNNLPLVNQAIVVTNLFTGEDYDLQTDHLGYIQFNNYYINSCVYEIKHADGIYYPQLIEINVDLYGNADFGVVDFTVPQDIVLVDQSPDSNACHTISNAFEVCRGTNISHIQVNPGTYMERVCVTDLGDNAQNFILEGMGTVVLHSDSRGRALMIHNFQNTVNELTIRNIIFEDSDNRGGGGVSLSGNIDHVTMESCTIRNCGDDFYMQGVEYFPIGLVVSVPIHINNCDFYDNHGNSGGSLVRSIGPIYLHVNSETNHSIIENCRIHDNHAGVSSAIRVSGKGQFVIRNNIIRNNYQRESGHTGCISSVNAENVEISNNVFDSNRYSQNDYSHFQYAINAVRNNDDPSCISIENNTVVSHNRALYLNNVNVSAINNVFDISNVGIYCYEGYEQSRLQYSHNIMKLGNCGTDAVNYDINLSSNHGNQFGDPKLTTNFVPIWNATCISPCIDAGYGTPDTDGSPRDIGAKPARTHRYWTYTFEDQADVDRWHWVSYPVLNSVTNNALMASVFFEELLLKHQDGNLDWQPTYLDEIRWYNQDIYSINWIDNSNEWNDLVNTHSVSSSQGYKIKLQYRMNPAFTWPVILQESGFKTSVTTQFPIYGGVENWLGYFKEEPAWPHEAFAAIWDDITTIKAKNWSLLRPNPVGDYYGMHGKVAPLRYGDMVIVTTRNNHTFRWGSGSPDVPNDQEVSKNFIYDEKPDYIPVYLNIPDDMMMDLKEIGLYVDGVCKGSVVVKDSLEQISAYVDSPDEISEGDVEFVFCYEEAKRPENELRAMNLNPGRLQPQYGVAGTSYPYFEIKLTQDDMEDIVPPEFSLKQNYPNPFNPSTTIRYSLPETARVHLDIYNLKGQLVKTLINSEMESGPHSVVWNGKDSNNQAVASGVYFYRISSPNNTQTKRMLLMK
ncbi:MAG: FlgD immunoglobulin-like domain containing protein [Candidatus Cloacimonadaceae bacterium]|jgi:hypothetical protein|nr:FlgD immunoglobulin-like domain containing protein [Candidatus Cloacimonadaceae bacterium]